MRSGAPAALLVACALSCLSRPAYVPQLFTIEPPPASTASPAARGRTILVGRVSVAAPFDGRELVYWTGAHQVERDPYAILAAPPAVLLAEVIRSRFPEPTVDEAAPARDAHRPALQLDVHFGELSGDFIHPERPAAVLVVTFQVSSARSAPLFRKEYTRRLALRERTAEAVVTAWNEGLAQVLGELERDLEAALPGLPAPSPPPGH